MKYFFLFAKETWWFFMYKITKNRFFEEKPYLFSAKYIWKWKQTQNIHNHFLNFKRSNAYHSEYLFALYAFYYLQNLMKSIKFHEKCIKIFFSVPFDLMTAKYIFICACKISSWIRFEFIQLKTFISTLNVISESFLVLSASICLRHKPDEMLC